MPDRNVRQDKKSGNVGRFNRQSAVRAKWGCTHACARSPAGHILCFDGAINRRKAAVKRIESRIRSVCLSPVRLAPSGRCLPSALPLALLDVVEWPAPSAGPSLSRTLVDPRVPDLPPRSLRHRRVSPSSPSSCHVLDPDVYLAASPLSAASFAFDGLARFRQRALSRGCLRERNASDRSAR